MYLIHWIYDDKRFKIHKKAFTFHLILDKVNGYLGEFNGNKYLTLVPTNESKEKSKKKLMENPSIIIVVRAIFLENNKCYPQGSLDECLYKLYLLVFSGI